MSSTTDAMGAPGRAPCRALSVSIHDVAAPTWSQCRQLIAALHDVGRFPLCLLLVPRWYGRPLEEDPAFIAALQSLLDDDHGHEVLLHGLYHQDDASAPASIRALIQRRVFTRNEGEFAALDAAQALARIRAGLNAVQACGLNCPPVHGFVPPAWLMSHSARQALLAEGIQLGLCYLSLFSGLLDLRSGRLLYAPALVYSARWRAGDALVRSAVSGLAGLMRSAPLLRLGLHPSDVRRPSNLRHAQRLVEQALRDRVPMTEGDWLEDHTRRSHEKVFRLQAGKDVES